MPKNWNKQATDKKKKKLGYTFLLVIGTSRSKQQQNTKVMPRLLTKQKKKIKISRNKPDPWFNAI